MDTPERIETLNDRLRDYYGIDSNTARPIFRIVWSEDQTENVLTDEIDGGIKLLHPIVRTIKKYSYIKNLYVLERLVMVPDMNRNEMLGMKQSYEPIWTYCRQDFTPLPPTWPATKLVIDTLLAALGKKSMAKYVEDEKETTKEGREQKIQELEQELFGNETVTTDALAHGEGIIVPRNFEKDV